VEVTAKQAEELFQFLRPEQVVRLSSVAEPVSFKPGATVYEQGSEATYLYVVLSGRVELLLPGRDGVYVLVNEIGVGELFGVCVCLGVPSYSVTARCSEDAWLLRVDAEVLKRLMDGDPEIGYALETQIAKIYYGRYGEAMRRLSGIVAHVGVGSECP
jgi:CRP-like cAMP-binding protein